MTGPNKTEQDDHAGDDSRIIVGECPYVRDAVEFIQTKMAFDGWHLVAQPFPLSIENINGQLVPTSWAFVLHKFY